MSNGYQLCHSCYGVSWILDVLLPGRYHQSCFPQHCYKCFFIPDQPHHDSGFACQCRQSGGPHIEVDLLGHRKSATSKTIMQAKDVTGVCDSQITAETSESPHILTQMCMACMSICDRILYVLLGLQLMDASHWMLFLQQR